jgi:thiamine-phosphate pyrophosphorylase
MSQMAAAPLLDLFYPIVPDIDWMRRLVQLGVKTIQLRLKNADSAEIDRQVRASAEICRAHACQLIVNDHWREAIAAGCDFIHLGQEDLAAANVAAIKAANLKLGVSTHSHEELETALAVKPDYIALGPIYETKLKAMKWAPQGLERVTEWKRRIGALPLCAIAGLTPERAAGVVAAGADSLAVITDFFTHTDPEGRVRQWLALTAELKARYPERFAPN